MKHKLENLFGAYRSDRSGNMAMLAGISLGLFMACGAAAADVSMWQSQKSKLQDAADSAALNGAIMLSNGAQYNGDNSGGGDGIFQNVQGDEGNGSLKRQIKETAEVLVHEYNDTTLTGYKSKVHVDPKEETVEVDLAVEVPRLFASMFMKNDPTIRVKSVATVVRREDPNCIYIMDTVGDNALKVAGNGTLKAPGCGIQVHSSSSSAMTNGTHSNLVSDKICVAGSYSGSGYSPTPESNCAVDPDPFAGLDVPVGGICDHTDFVATSSTTLYPGTYCGGLTVGNNFHMRLTPGMYFIRDGKLKLTSSGSITGDGVVFILEGFGSLDVNSDGKFITTPPTYGPLKGFSIAQSPTALLGQKTNVSGFGSIDFGGTIYAPRQIFELTGKSSSNSHTPTYGAIVGYQLKIAGQGDLIVRNGEDGAGVKDTVRLVR